MYPNTRKPMVDSNYTQSCKCVLDHRPNASLCNAPIVLDASGWDAMPLYGLIYECQRSQIKLSLMILVSDKHSQKITLVHEL